MNVFPNEACFNNHLNCTVKWGPRKEDKTICFVFKKCGACSKYLHAPGRPRSDPHDCDAVYCPLCTKFQAQGHLCFMKTEEDAVYERRLVRKKQKSHKLEDHHGIEDLLFEEADFLPDTAAQSSDGEKVSPSNRIKIRKFIDLMTSSLLSKHVDLPVFLFYCVLASSTIS